MKEKTKQKKNDFLFQLLFDSGKNKLHNKKISLIQNENETERKQGNSWEMKERSNKERKKKKCYNQCLASFIWSHVFLSFSLSFFVFSSIFFFCLSLWLWLLLFFLFLLVLEKNLCSQWCMRTTYVLHKSTWIEVKEIENKNTQQAKSFGRKR